MGKKINLFKIFDYILCFMLFILAIKKGGFYKSDTILFNLVINIIAIISVIISNVKNKDVKVKNKIGILSLLFAVAYIFPILVKNYSSLNDSIFEMIRYFNIYLIYCIVKNSDNKKMYINVIIIIAIFLVILGIDQIANGYFARVLSNFNSGYLTSNNITRMSSTIQYANVFALICLIAYIFTFNNKRKIYVTNIYQFILLSGIILSESRVTIFLTILITIYEIVKNKNIDKKHFIFTILYTFIFIVLINKFINNNLNVIYIVSIIAFLLNLIFTYILNKVDNKACYKMKNKWWLIGYISCIIVFGALCLCIHTDIYLNSYSDKSFITRNIYDFSITESNNLEIVIDELQEDTRYEIEIIKVNYDNELELVEKLHYYSTTTGKFNIDIEKDIDLKYINININCTKGSLKVKNISINGKKVAMDYLFLPSNLVYRIIDGLHSSNSFKYRIEYQKDAMKIVNNSILNFTFGIGGEGFKNTYNYVKNVNYSSTEVHNIYLQIFVESGIIGFLIFLIIIIYILRNYKMNTSKLALICIFIHGIFDLDFSYMVILAIFGILLGTIEEKENKKESKFYFDKRYIEQPLAISICFITTVILIFSNFASRIKLYEITDLDDIISIENKIVNYEKMVKFDMFEYKYRMKLNEVYSIYLEKLYSEIYVSGNKEKYNNTIDKLLKNLGYLQNNESTNYSNLLGISDQYISALDYITKFNNSDKSYIFSNIYYNILKLYNTNDSKLRQKVENVYIRYVNEVQKLL